MIPIRGERLAFDTNAIIYFTNRTEPYFSWLVTIFEDVEAGRKRAIVSILTEIEATIHPLRFHDTDKLERTRALLSHSQVELVDTLRPIARQAAKLRADLKLGLVDSVILATAVSRGCDAVVGNDKTCATRFKELPYIYLDDAVRAH